MAIDRSFIVQGHGTVVTGSVTSGTLRIGDEVEWLPRCEKVRVRSLQNHGRSVDEVRRGMRAAINLAGVHHENVMRGQELATPGYLLPARTVTVRLHSTPPGCHEAGRSIKHRAAVRFHIGTAEVMGTVALLDVDRVEPGGWALAQVFLREPVTAAWGQPFVIRAASATQTLGGGQVLQPAGRKISRRQAEALDRLQRLWGGAAEQRVLATASFAGFAGVTTADLVRGAGLAPDEAEELARRLRDRGELIGVGHAPGLIHIGVVRDLEERVLKALGRTHSQSPLQAAHERRKLRALFAYVGDDDVVELALDRLIRDGRLIGDATHVRRADFRPRLSMGLQRLKEKVLAAYVEAGLRPPNAASFAGQAGGNAAHLNDLLALCVAEGHLVHLDEDFYMHRAAAERVQSPLDWPTRPA
jgi:selenocysteine-specific elongation factor